MTSWLGLLWLVFLSAFIAWALAAAAALLLAQLPAIRAGKPDVCARRAILLALLPWLVPSITAGSIFMLAAAKPLGLIADHCLYHGPGHPHLCLQHLPAIGVGQLHLLGVTVVFMTLSLLFVRYLVRERRMSARLRSMRFLAHGHGRLRILEEQHSFAVAANPLNPFILISRGLLNKLSWRERRIVLAHEVSHLRRHDLLKNVLFDVLLLVHLPRAGRRLRVVWRQALEERADDCVAARFGADSVAQALIQAVRANTGDCAPGFSVSGADTRRRIERLIAPAEAKTRRLAFESCFFVLLLAVSIGVPIGHHGLETLLGFLTGG